MLVNRLFTKFVNHFIKIQGVEQNPKGTQAFNFGLKIVNGKQETTFPFKPNKRVQEQSTYFKQFDEKGVGYRPLSL